MFYLLATTKTSVVLHHVFLFDAIEKNYSILGY